MRKPYSLSSREDQFPCEGVAPDELGQALQGAEVGAKSDINLVTTRRDRVGP